MSIQKSDVRPIRLLKPGDVFRFTGPESIAKRRFTSTPDLGEEYVVYEHCDGRHSYGYDRYRVWMTTACRSRITYFFYRSWISKSGTIPELKDMPCHYSDYSYYQRKRIFSDTHVRVVGHLTHVARIRHDRRTERA